MKIIKKIILITIIFTMSSFIQKKDEKYVLIKSVTTKSLNGRKKEIIVEINKKDIDKLNEPLKAIAAYYSAMAGSNCDAGRCELTTALELDGQGSEKHKQLINKWFPNDKVAKQLIAQNCFQPSSGSSYFRDYNYLMFKVKADTVIINYEVTVYNHGKNTILKGPDKAVVRNDEIIILKQNIWKRH